MMTSADTPQDPSSTPTAPVWSARRDPSQTRQATRKAALDLLAQGKWPSRTLVRAQTRRGSPKDIERYLAELFVDIRRAIEPTADGELLHAGGLPSQVVAAVHTLLDALRDEASDRLKRELVDAQRRAAGANQRALESDRQRGQAENESEALRRELGRLEELRDQLKRQIDDEIVDRRRAERKLTQANRKMMLLTDRRARLRPKRIVRKKATAGAARKRARQAARGGAKRREHLKKRKRR